MDETNGCFHAWNRNKIHSRKSSFHRHTVHVSCISLHESETKLMLFQNDFIPIEIYPFGTTFHSCITFTENELHSEMKTAEHAVSWLWRMRIVFKTAENSVVDESTCSKMQNGQKSKKFKKDTRWKWNKEKVFRSSCEMIRPFQRSWLCFFPKWLLFWYHVNSPSFKNETHSGTKLIQEWNLLRKLVQKWNAFRNEIRSGLKLVQNWNSSGLKLV